MKKKFDKKEDSGGKFAPMKKNKFRGKERPSKSGRLVVRNLPFKCTEEELQEHLSQYGEVAEVSFVRRDGKFTGCSFVQFTTKKSAALAVVKTSGKEFKGRVVIVDWAVPKAKFQGPQGDVKPEIKEEVESDVEVKEEIKEEPCSDEEIEDGEEDEDTKAEIKREPTTRKRIIDDPENTRTVFIKNVPFLATNEDLEKAAEELGPVSYALICVDPVTEHSKGTGFIRFYDEQIAQDLINGVTSLTVRGITLQALRVKPKNELEDDQAKKQPKDTRNLYLAKEGVILAGSSAAEGVSESDMRKRLQLESWKSRVLKDLHMFVSPTRLIVHNVPPFYDDARLAKLVKEHAPRGAVVKETRIMKTVNDDVLGKSKGYAFVAFTRHEDALAFLRKMNNNPEIFIEKKRPIVSFSIENRRALNLKEKRQQNSALNLKKQTDKRHQDSPKPIDEGPAAKFMGIPAKSGKNKLRQRHKLKEQAALHKKNLKKSKKKPKISRKQKRQKRKQQF